MEKRDLYDANRNLTGKTIYKGEKIPEGSYINVVLVFIQNYEGKFLIQKRSEMLSYIMVAGLMKNKFFGMIIMLKWIFQI